MSVPTVAAGVLIDRAAAAPAAGIADLLGPGRLLVLAPHPDDETLGCGAALAAALARVPVTVALLTDGAASHPGSRSHPPQTLAALRRTEFDAATALLAGGRTLETLRFERPDTRLAEFVAPTAAALADYVRSERVGTVWATWRGDPHADHVATAAIADRIVAAHPGLVRRDYAVWGRFGDAGAAAGTVLRFEPGAHGAAKRAAMACYRSQLTPLIADDPDGFVMPAALVDHFAAASEIFLA